MTDVRNIRIEDYGYPLPEERIALHPLERRDACKLLAVNKAGKITHTLFSDLPLFLKPDTLIVANETKVIRARLEFVKDTGARIEVFLLEPFRPHDYAVNFSSTESCAWVCLVGNKKRWKDNPLCRELSVKGEKVRLYAFLGADQGSGSGVEVRFEWDNPDFTFAEVIEAAGNIPIPPYLKRDSEESDLQDYQTVYSHTEGSVAAPTAGLHFTPELLSRLKKHGCEFVTVTLHVGAGTFQPVKSELIGGHPMHSEWLSVSKTTLRRLIGALEEGRDILAVGTTSVRTLESLPYLGVAVGQKEKPDVEQWIPYEERYRDIDTIHALKKLLGYMQDNGRDSIEANTSIMIVPGFRWRIVNRLITNFHQPLSTLLLLVSSFTGRDPEGGERWRRVYDEALGAGYRFLSYGDACLFSRGRQPVELPLSKSMVIRAATIAAVNNPEELDRFAAQPLCDDAAYYIRALKQVLASVESGKETDVYIGEGAAPLRFLLAFAASLPGARVRIACAPALWKRPISPLVDALLAMGADIRISEDPAGGVIAVSGKKLRGGRIEVDSSFTSQYLSALLLASPLWERKAVLPESLVSVSRPYLEMSVRMMREPGCRPEPDWSAAAFFYEYALISRTTVEIARLTPPAVSLQGDAVVCDIYGRLGVETRMRGDGSASLVYDAAAFRLLEDSAPFEFDFTDYPDMVPSVAVALCCRRIPFVFHGVAHLRYKECDRLSALQSLLVRIGYEVSVEEGSLIFNGEFRPLQEFPVEIDSYGDHRIAMAFYPLELLGMVSIEGKDVVSKSFPDFYQQFK